MNHLQEHLTYIYLREDLIDKTEDVVNNNTLTKVPNEREALKMLDAIPMLSTVELKRQASRNPNFKNYYNQALQRLGDQGDTILGEGLAVLYASSRSAIDESNDSSLKNKLIKKLDKLFDYIWNNPGKIATKGFRIWMASFMMLFIFWWLPSAREILKTSRKVAMVMMMVGIVFATIKFFTKRIKKM